MYILHVILFQNYTFAIGLAIEVHTPTKRSFHVCNTYFYTQ